MCRHDVFHRKATTISIILRSHQSITDHRHTWLMWCGCFCGCGESISNSNIFNEHKNNINRPTPINIGTKYTMIEKQCTQKQPSWTKDIQRRGELTNKLRIWGCTANNKDFIFVGSLCLKYLLSCKCKMANNWLWINLDISYFKVCINNVIQIHMLSRQFLYFLASN